MGVSKGCYCQELSRFMLVTSFKRALSKSSQVLSARFYFVEMKRATIVEIGFYVEKFNQKCKSTLLVFLTG